MCGQYHGADPIFFEPLQYCLASAATGAAEAVTLDPGTRQSRAIAGQTAHLRTDKRRTTTLLSKYHRFLAARIGSVHCRQYRQGMRVAPQ